MNMAKTSVERDTQEWQQLEYRLQLFLGLPAASPVTIYRFQASVNELRDMQSLHQGKQVVEACLDTTDLDDTAFKKLFSRKTDMKSLSFETGHLNIDAHNEPRTRRYSLLMLKIVIGDSMVIQQSESDLLDSIPDPYDSCYLVGREEKQNAFHHNYILKNRSQYVIEYEIVYTLNGEKEYNPRDIVCNKCEKRTAVAYCRQEQAYFCSECNITHHKDKLLANHQRQNIKLLNSLGRCVEHGRQLTLYCQDENKFLCIDCTLSGRHSSGQYAKHRVVVLEKFYSEKETDNNRVAITKKDELSNDINRVDDYIRQIDEHFNEMFLVLKEKFERAHNELKRVSKVKVGELEAVKTSLRRQLDQCIWTESFIRYQQQVLKPNFYLEAQQQFDQYMNRLLETHSRPVRTVETQLVKIEGDVFVTERKSRSRSGSARSRKTNRNIGLDFYERNQQEERNIKSNAALPTRNNELSNKSQNYPRSDYNEPIRKHKPPSDKESHLKDADWRVSEFAAGQAEPLQIPGLKFPRRIQPDSRYDTGRSRTNQDASEDYYSPSEQVGSSSRRTPPKNSSPNPGNKSASQILKNKFGQLGLI